MIIIGEKINGSIPAVAEAIANRDAEVIKQRNLFFVAHCVAILTIIRQFLREVGLR